jgi:hypothetical protein
MQAECPHPMLGYRQYVAMTTAADADLALAILRKIAADPEACILTEHGSFLIDSLWQQATPEEADLIDRLRSDVEDT